MTRHIFVAFAGPLEAYALSAVNGSPRYISHIIRQSTKKQLAGIRALLKTYHLTLTLSHYTLTLCGAASFQKQSVSEGVVQRVLPAVVKVSSCRYLHTLMLASWIPTGSVRLTDLLLTHSRKKASRPFPVYLILSVLVQLLSLCDYLCSCNSWPDFPWHIFSDCLTPSSIWLTPNGYIKLAPKFSQFISGQCSTPKPRRDSASGLQVLLHKVGMLCLELLAGNRKVALKFPTVSEFHATVHYLHSLVVQKITKGLNSSSVQLLYNYVNTSQIDWFFNLLRALSNPFAVHRIDFSAAYDTVRAALQPVFDVQMGVLEVDSKGVTRYMRALEACDLAQARLLLHIEGLRRDQKNMTALHRLAINGFLRVSTACWLDLACVLNLDTLNAIDNDGQYALRYLWLNGTSAVQALIDISRLSSSATYLTDISASTINRIIHYGTRRCPVIRSPSATVFLPPSKHAYTPLMYAALNGLEQAVIGLVDQYAGTMTEDGTTAGTFAMQRGYRIVANYLANHELVRIQTGLTMLQSLLVIAESEEDPEALAQLANDACRLLHMTSFHALFTGDTALIIASRRGLLTKACLLGVDALVNLYTTLLSIEAGMVNAEQNTSLMCVCQSGKTLQNECKALIEAGEAGRCTPAGITALMYASQVGCIEHICLLLPYEGGRCSVAGETALELSAFALNKKAVSLIAEHEGPEYAASVASLLIAACGRGQFSRVDFVKVQHIVTLLLRSVPCSNTK